LQRNTLVLRATSPPDAQFSVLDETGREIGRVVGEGRLSRNEPAQLVLYAGSRHASSPSSSAKRTTTAPA
jgi:hypothetical protein